MKMKISELKSNQGNVEVEGTIKDVGETRNFNKYGRELRVANAILSDDSGSIKLTLWNDDVTRFRNGDVVKVNNGYVSEFQGEKQLTSGKFGTIQKIRDGDGSSQMDLKGSSKKVDEEDEFSDEDLSEEEPQEEF